MSIKGIDVSEYQGVIDWAKVKTSGVEFAMIRATYGQHSNDIYFQSNLRNAQANGIMCGAYHYCYSTTVEAAKVEAEHFIGALKGNKFEYPVVLDIEDTSIKALDKDTITQIVNTFCSMLEQAGYWAMFYANLDWVKNVLDMSVLNKFALWLAQWNETCSYSCGIWQYSNEGVVDGINGNVDLDVDNVGYYDRILAKGLNSLNSPVVDPDIHLSVRVRTSKANTIIEQIVSMGYITKILDLA